VTYDASNALGCGAFSNVSRATGVGHSTVVLVDRGECFFVEKAWRAQQAGANAVIVADDVDEGLVTMAQPDAADDGASSEIAELAERVTIPSALVTKSGAFYRATNVSFSPIARFQHLIASPFE
jgi:hypothetical protein